MDVTFIGQDGTEKTVAGLPALALLIRDGMITNLTFVRNTREDPWRPAERDPDISALLSLAEHRDSVDERKTQVRAIAGPDTTWHEDGSEGAIRWNAWTVGVIAAVMVLVIGGGTAFVTQQPGTSGLADGIASQDTSRIDLSSFGSPLKPPPDLIVPSHAATAPQLDYSGLKPIGADQFPPDGIKAMTDSCATRPRADLPATAVPEYCRCWLNTIQQKVSWSQVVSADHAVRTVGIQNLEPIDKKTMVAMLMAGEKCFRRVLR